jgi:hypothetical protein
MSHFWWSRTDNDRRHTNINGHYFSFKWFCWFETSYLVSISRVNSETKYLGGTNDSCYLCEKCWWRSPRNPNFLTNWICFSHHMWYCKGGHAWISCNGADSSFCCVCELSVLLFCYKKYCVVKFFALLFLFLVCTFCKKVMRRTFFK